MHHILKFTFSILHFIRIIIMLAKPEGTKALIAENMMLRKQLIQLSRKHKRSPKLSFLDRLLFAILAHFINPTRLIKSAIIIKPATIIKFHKALIIHQSTRGQIYYVIDSFKTLYTLLETDLVDLLMQHQEKQAVRQP